MAFLAEWVGKIMTNSSPSIRQENHAHLNRFECIYTFAGAHNHQRDDHKNHFKF